jgi:RNA polymerase sigma factor for flagellar operon FliA
MLTTDQEATVLEHLPLVGSVARRVARRLPRAVALEDLISAGTIGLLNATERFDPSRAVPFAPYAKIRIRGAILDHLRAMDWLPRTTRTAVKAGDSTTAVVSVEDVRADGFDSFEMETPSPSASLERREQVKKLSAAVSRLRLRNRQILALYYVEELTLKQIGEIFGVSESRVCQLHTEAVQCLRRELADDVDVG